LWGKGRYKGKKGRGGLTTRPIVIWGGLKGEPAGPVGHPGVVGGLRSAPGLRKNRGGRLAGGKKNTPRGFKRREGGVPTCAKKKVEGTGTKMIFVGLGSTGELLGTRPMKWLKLYVCLTGGAKRRIAKMRVGRKKGTKNFWFGEAPIHLFFENKNKTRERGQWQFKPFGEGHKMSMRTRPRQRKKQRQGNHKMQAGVLNERRGKAIRKGTTQKKNETNGIQGGGGGWKKNEKDPGCEKKNNCSGQKMSKKEDF